MAVKKTFEQQLERLEEIVSTLEENEIGLETALKLYKEGMTISANIDKILGKAKQEVIVLDNSDEERDNYEF